MKFEYRLNIKNNILFIMSHVIMEKESVSFNDT